MNDGIIKGDGNSRYLKTVADALTLYPTHESLLQALVEGTFPIDLNGINLEGWKQIGTDNNKANLLSDETAALLGGVETVNEALVAAKNTAVTEALAKGVHFETGEYVGTGANATVEITFSFTPKIWGIYGKAPTTGSITYAALSNIYAWDLNLSGGSFWHIYQRGNSYSGSNARFNFKDKTVSWSIANSPNEQLNELNFKYYYFAIGKEETT